MCVEMNYLFLQNCYDTLDKIKDMLQESFLNLQGAIVILILLEISYSLTD